MPRPPPNLYKKTRPDNISKCAPNVPSTSTPPTPLTPEQEQQFESELYWCIQQLQQALSSNKLNNKQIQDNTKALNILMNSNAPLVKKRQIMRLSFGDYRTKMAAEEKKAKALSLKVVPSKPSQKSVFIKKASTSAEKFMFNFPSPVEGIGNAEEKSVLEEIPKSVSDKNMFGASDNSFRFNFQVEETFE